MLFYQNEVGGNKEQQYGSKTISRTSSYWPSRLEVQNTPTASLKRGKLPYRGSWTRHWTVWRWGFHNAGVLGMPSTPLLPSDWYHLIGYSMGQIELNCVLIWIVWNRTVLTFNFEWINDWCLIELLMIHRNTWNHLSSLNSLRLDCFWHLNWVLMLNWIVWNRIVYMYKNGFGIK